MTELLIVFRYCL